MPAAAREIERDVMSVLHGTGAKVLGKGLDGGNHRTVTFEYRDQQKTFHYASSPQPNGRTRMNTVARLRRIIREIPTPVVVAAPAPTPVVADKPISVPIPTSPTPKRFRFDKEGRREFGKRYLSLRCHKTLSAEVEITPTRCIELLRSLKGDPALLIEKELLRLRTFARQAARGETTKPKEVAVKKPSAPEYKLPVVIPAKRGAYADNFRRNVQMTRTVAVENVPIEVVAKHYAISVTRVTQIVKENHQYRNWKFD